MQIKKSPLLAVMLLSSAAQAETWVCSTPSKLGGSYLHKLVRQEAEFDYTVTIPADQWDGENSIDSDPLELLIETDVTLTLASIDPDGVDVTVFMINKETKQFVIDAVYFEIEGGKELGSCVEI